MTEPSRPGSFRAASQRGNVIRQFLPCCVIIGSRPDETGSGARPAAGLTLVQLDRNRGQTGQEVTMGMGKVMAMLGPGPGTHVRQLKVMPGAARLTSAAWT
jgi:hypothetical protein